MVVEMRVGCLEGKSEQNVERTHNIRRNRNFESGVFNLPPYSSSWANYSLKSGQRKVRDHIARLFSPGLTIHFSSNDKSMHASA